MTITAEDIGLIQYHINRILPQFHNVSVVTSSIADNERSGLRLEAKERRDLFSKVQEKWNDMPVTTRNKINKLVQKLANNSLYSLDIYAIVDTCLLHNVAPEDIIAHFPALVNLCYQLQDIEVALTILKEKLNSNGE